MCNAFSGLLHKDKGVLWELGTDNHSELVGMHKLKDDTDRKDGMMFARFEIIPQNGDYLNPDKWIFKLDEQIKPDWWNEGCETLCREAHKEWLEELETILVRKPIINPFKDITNPKRITPKHLDLLKKWNSTRDSVRASVWDSVWDSVRASVRDSVGDSVWDSVWDSVGDSAWDSVWDSVGDSVRASVRDSVGDSVWDSVWDSVGDSVWASVGAYYSSFFNLQRSSWKYTDYIKCGADNPFQPCVDLWEMGLVPSYDGTTWRLHGGKNAKILWEGKL